MVDKQPTSEQKKSDKRIKKPGPREPLGGSSEQGGIAPSVYDKDLVMPIGKPGVRIKDEKR
ncbi:hypothetical protein [Rhizobium leucaenae]|jgi:hypothetical protein|uniref:Uncharacterized protein n=1 Tax=Rhizobium leucaenae TaxID=29450 RepID=A0A7W7EMW4_9HYPH|nr:hypothetical protein [Rhizobium leucaenae]MBB4571486.1 hypothetical protein [Rhizobium leucaenae]MBB6304807.1 hypothetical protein [Rhizobium leucaenae]